MCIRKFLKKLMNVCSCLIIIWFRGYYRNRPFPHLLKGTDSRLGFLHPSLGLVSLYMHTGVRCGKVFWFRSINLNLEYLGGKKAKSQNNKSPARRAWGWYGLAGSNLVLSRKKWVSITILVGNWIHFAL